MKFTFSGHESFPCKSLWLKKDYDFVPSGKIFSDPSAVIDLVVDKNYGCLYTFLVKSVTEMEKE